jgi:hypothetical protein
MNNNIYMYWYCESSLTMIERANTILEYAKSVLNLFDIDFFEPFKRELYPNITEDEMKEIILKQIKNPVKRFYKVKKIEDDFNESIPSNLGWTSMGLKFNFTIGGAGNLIPNCLIIEIPKEYQEEIRPLFVKSIEFFNPEWGVVTQMEFCYNIASQANEEYKFGWMTYFSEDTATRILSLLNKKSLLTKIFS